MDLVLLLSQVYSARVPQSMNLDKESAVSINTEKKEILNSSEKVTKGSNSGNKRRPEEA